ncbi:MAG TPA: ComEC/Rec2 family competence protein [Pirellulales bacterium]|nr:ComEC/Rec2 family competence protein [Pirellulales bacterium]
MHGDDTVGDRRWPRYQPLVLVAAACAAGIVADRLVALRTDAWLALGFTTWCLWFLVRRRRTALPTALLALALAGLGGAWHHQHWFLSDRHEIGLYAAESPRPACVEAIAIGSPRQIAARPPNPLRAIQQQDRSRLTVQLVALRDGDRWLPASGMTQVWVDGTVSDVHRGDRLRIVGQLSAPAGPQNPGEFDFAGHSRADRQRSRLAADFVECVQVIERGSFWSPAGLLDRLRQRGHELLWRQIDARRAALASALLLGVRDELDEQTNVAFAKTGTIHLLSISGLHVGILSMFLFGILRLGLIGRRLALACVAITTIVYALVISAEPPAVRATIVVLLVCLATLLRQRPLSFNLLAAGALVVLVMNPCDLFRIGPQLSFLAVAALIGAGGRFAPRPIADPLDRLIAQTRPWHVKRARRWASRLLQGFAISFCVWATGVPLVLSQFHLISPATLALTPLLAVPVATALISGFLLLTVGWLVWPLAAMCGAVCDWSLWAIDACIDYAASLPWSHAWAPGPAFWWLAGFYAALAACVVAPRWCPPPRWCLAGFAGWTALGFGLPLAAGRASPRLECTFLSVGHGCAVLLELPGGENVLYDAGRLGSPEAGARSIAGYLWHRGITRLDAIVLSHADVDHYNAVPELLTKFRVGVIYVTPAMLRDESPAIETLLAAVRQSGVPLRETWSGDRLRVASDCLLEVWHPTRRGVLGSDNANSLVLDVEYQDRRILLTGDLESPGIDDLLAESPCHCDVVLTPHHGSARSNPPGFAAWSTPEVAVVSGSANDRRPEVDRAYRQRGACVLNTADCGAIHLAVTRERIEASTWKPVVYGPTSESAERPAEAIALYRP